MDSEQERGSQLPWFSQSFVFIDCWLDRPRVKPKGHGGMTRKFGERSPLLLDALAMIFLARHRVKL